MISVASVAELFLLKLTKLNLLARYNIPLVILEACRTSEVDDVAFRSVAPRLIEAGVGSVVAMSYAVLGWCENPFSHPLWQESFPAPVSEYGP